MQEGCCKREKAVTIRIPKLYIVMGINNVFIYAVTWEKNLKTMIKMRKAYKICNRNIQREGSCAE
jgi:hypothetical protein